MLLVYDDFYGIVIFSLVNQFFLYFQNIVETTLATYKNKGSAATKLFCCKHAVEGVVKMQTQRLTQLRGGG